MRVPRGRASKIVNGVTEYRPPLLIHNLGVLRQTIYAALENSRGLRELSARHHRRHACSHAADPNPSV